MEWRAPLPRFERSMNREAGSALSKGLRTTILILTAMVVMGLVHGARVAPGGAAAAQHAQRPRSRRAAK